MPNIRTANKRARRREGPSMIVLDVFEKNGKPFEELLIVQNGKAKRHSPKIGTPPHFRAEGDSFDWVGPEGRD